MLLPASCGRLVWKLVLVNNMSNLFYSFIILGLVFTSTVYGDIFTNTPNITNPQSKAISNNSRNGSIKTENKASGNISNSNVSIGEQQMQLDVYIGKCSYTPAALSAVKEFKARHKNAIVIFYPIKTHQNGQFDMNQLTGVEFKLPVETKKYAITMVPSYIFKVKNKVYKASGGRVDLSDIYDNILTNKASGTAAQGFIELDTEGQTCQGNAPDLKPKALTPAQKKDILSKITSPDVQQIVSQMAVPLPATEAVSEIKIRAGGGDLLSKYIIFSIQHAKWAKKQLTVQGTMGCCTDCDSIGAFWPQASFCSPAMLKKYGVESVPTVISFSK